MNNPSLSEWLFDSDPSIRWQVIHDILEADEEQITRERQKISTHGWGSRLLSFQDENGIWGGQLYNNKWLSTTYTMLLLRQFGLENINQQAHLACKVLLAGGYKKGGRISFAKSIDSIDHGVEAMILFLMAYFRYEDPRVHEISEHLLHQQLENGSWEPYPGNMVRNYSFDTTFLCLDALWEYEKQYPERIDGLLAGLSKGREFLLNHKLYKYELTGAIIDKKMTLFAFPPRWHYDVLVGLDHFRDCNADRDLRLDDAITLLRSKQKPDGTWNLQNRHAGKTFFEMEITGKPSKWNTMRALRILKWWDGE